MFFSLSDSSKSLGRNPWETPIGSLSEDSLATLRRVYSGYGDMPPWGTGPAPATLVGEGNSYIRREFPRIDFIRSCAYRSAADVAAGTRWTCGPQVAGWALAGVLDVFVIMWWLLRPWDVLLSEHSQQQQQEEEEEGEEGPARSAFAGTQREEQAIQTQSGFTVGP